MISPVPGGIAGPGPDARSQGSPSSVTRVFAVLGDPVAHSLSPRMQNAAFRAMGVDGVYVALRASAADLPGLLRGLARANGGGNVTLPHKAAALAAADEATPAARRTGAANTFWLQDGRVHADNTDVEGFARALADFREGGAEGADVLVVGAGGAARAVVSALVDQRARSITLLNRTTSRARRLADDWPDAPIRVVDDETGLRDTAPDLVVNATRLGLDARDPPPVDLEALGGAGMVLDLVYGRDGRGTPLTRAAGRLGLPSRDGLDMLVLQGAAAFERWWGVDAPLDAMRAAVEGRPVG